MSYKRNKEPEYNSEEDEDFVPDSTDYLESKIVETKHSVPMFSVIQPNTNPN